MHRWFLFTLIDKNFIAFVLSNYKYFVSLQYVILFEQLNWFVLIHYR
jgi:hypothetical protein